jgi:hypothetical protein
MQRGIGASHPLCRIDQCRDERVQDEEERPVHLLARDVLERPAQGEDPHRDETRAVTATQAPTMSAGTYLTTLSK